MHHHYNDIRSRISEPPKWWDEHAVPRYCAFAPNETANIYCDEVALIEIACQNCGTHFLVAFSRDLHWWIYHQMERVEYKQLATLAEQHAWLDALSKQPLADAIRGSGVSFGDPPNTGCCPAGPTMSSDTIRVCEYWHKDSHRYWVRDRSLEIPQDTIYES